MTDQCYTKFKDWVSISQLGISQVKETHITRDICVSKVGEHVSLGICVSQVGEHISLGICVSHVGEHILLGICVSQVP